MTVLLWLWLPLASAGPAETASTGATGATGDTSDTGAPAPPAEAPPVVATDSGLTDEPAAVSAASLAGEVGGCRCAVGGVPTGAWLVGLGLGLALARRRQAP